MRIVIACPSRARFHILSEQSVGLGGVETACIELATALAARGHAVTLLSPTEEPQSVGGVKNVGLDAIDSINDGVLILANDATLFRRSHYPCNVMWIHNPLALEKAVRKGHMGPIIRHRPH